MTLKHQEPVSTSVHWEAQKKPSLSRFRGSGEEDISLLDGRVLTRSLNYTHDPLAHNCVWFLNLGSLQIELSILRRISFKMNRAKRGAPTRQTAHSIDEVLQGIQTGSRSQISQLKTLWPRDANDAKKVVEALFELLSTTRIPRNDDTPLRRKDAPQGFLINTVLEVIEDTVLPSTEHMDQNYGAHVFALFSQHIQDLVTALEFRIRHCVVDPEKGHPELTGRLGNILAARFVHDLLGMGITHFEKEEGYETLQTIADFLLKSWIRGAAGTKSPEETTLSPSDYNIIEKTLHNTSSSANLPPMMSLYRKRSLPSTARFSTLSPKVSLTTVSNGAPHFDVLVSFSHLFIGDIPAFHKELYKLGFPSLALKLGSKYRQAPASSGSSGSTAMCLAHRLAHTSVAQAWSAVHVLPQLLEAGLLELLAEDAIAEKPFVPKRAMENPLQQICRVAQHPVILKALREAEGKVVEKMGRQAVATARRFWMFLDAMDNQDWLHLRVQEIGQPFICSCLEHNEIGIKDAAKFYECARCRTVSYCSKRCQEQDWDMLHRDECAYARLNRMETKRQYVPASHTERVKALYALEPVLRGVLKDPAHPDAAESEDITTKQPIYYADSMKFPLEAAFCPSTEFLFTQPWSATNDAPPFEDSRFRTMVRQAERDEHIQLIASTTMFGEYCIAALAAFDLRRREGDRGGQYAREVLYGHVRFTGPAS
ncbi:hypothetical protein NMY22_g7160 [Coprinellus aureogranulatus]|nr:hypothetical protein NMY22_g7160 [Coprinellus aureogranulatus]